MRYGLTVTRQEQVLITLMALAVMFHNIKLRRISIL